MRTTRLLSGLWLLTVAGLIALWVWAAITLPASVPLHLDFSGEATRWGSRWELLGVLGVAALFTVGLPWVIAAVIRRGGALTFVNIPFKQWWLATPRREREVRHRLAVDMVAISMLTAWMFIGALGEVIALAGGPAAFGWFRWLWLSAMGVIFVYSVVASVLRYRPDKEWAG
ncbi:MAG: DUF1648 domain-containing protein [Propionibacteriaceae bacterium]|nr:DUF1648 domain-containing protein [Propionibacteriaceae bacterium]